MKKRAFRARGRLLKRGANPGKTIALPGKHTAACVICQICKFSPLALTRLSNYAKLMYQQQKGIIMSEEKDKDKAELDKQAEIDAQWKAMPWVLLFFAVVFLLINIDWESDEDKKAKAAENQAAMEEYKKFAECEVSLKFALRSPYSYQLIQYDVYDTLVHIDYEAQNGFGVLLRGRYTCTFNIYGGLISARDRN